MYFLAHYFSKAGTVISYIVLQQCLIVLQMFNIILINNQTREKVLDIYSCKIFFK